MKRFVAILVVCLMVFSVTTMSYAALRKDRGSFRGKVVNINTVKNEITVTNGKQEKTFVAKKPLDPNISRGTTVIIIYDKKTGKATFVRPGVRRKK